MIVYYLIRLIQEIFKYGLDLLSFLDFDFPINLSGAVAGIISSASGWNWILPVYEVVGLIHWTIMLYFGIFSYWVVKFIIVNVIRGSDSSKVDI